MSPTFMARFLPAAGNAGAWPAAIMSTSLRSAYDGTACGPGGRHVPVSPAEIQRIGKDGVRLIVLQGCGTLDRYARTKPGRNKSATLSSGPVVQHRGRVQTSNAPAFELDRSVGQVTISNAGHRTIGQREWPALVRKLDRDNPDHADQAAAIRMRSSESCRSTE